MSDFLHALLSPRSMKQAWQRWPTWGFFVCIVGLPLGALLASCGPLPLAQLDDPYAPDDEMSVPPPSLWPMLGLGPDPTAPPQVWIHSPPPPPQACGFFALAGDRPPYGC
jgi:hypothetical protein